MLMERFSHSIPALTQQTIDTLFIPHDIQRLESYTRNQIEYRLILDLTTDMSQLVFEGKMNDVPIDSLQKAILLGIGLQNKTLDKLSEEFNMPVNQILAKFFDCCKKLTKKIETVNASTIEETMVQETKLNMGGTMTPTAQSLADELEKGAEELAKAQKKELKRLKNENLSGYAIKGTNEEWSKALASNKSSIISVKRLVFEFEWQQIVRAMTKHTLIFFFLLSVVKNVLTIRWT